MGRYTPLSRSLVEDALSRIDETHLNTVTDDVFLKIENTPELKNRYDDIVHHMGDGKSQYVNAGIGRILKNIIGCESTGMNKNPKSNLIDSYTQFA